MSTFGLSDPVPALSESRGYLGTLPLEVGLRRKH